MSLVYSSDWVDVGKGMALRVNALGVLAGFLGLNRSDAHADLTRLLGYGDWEGLRVAHWSQGPNGLVHRQLEALTGRHGHAIWKTLEARSHG